MSVGNIAEISGAILCIIIILTHAEFILFRVPLYPYVMLHVCGFPSTYGTCDKVITDASMFQIFARNENQQGSEF
jgi:hypothetical protein